MIPAVAAAPEQGRGRQLGHEVVRGVHGLEVLAQEVGLGVVVLMLLLLDNVPLGVGDGGLSKAAEDGVRGPHQDQGDRGLCWPGHTGCRCWGGAGLGLLHRSGWCHLQLFIGHVSAETIVTSGVAHYLK